VAVSGLMLVFGSIDTATFTDGDFVSMVRDGWWWCAVYLGLAVVGVLAQSRSVDSLRATMREQWAPGRGTQDDLMPPRCSPAAPAEVTPA
jgi:hypothetical protein